MPINCEFLGSGGGCTHTRAIDFGYKVKCFGTLNCGVLRRLKELAVYPFNVCPEESMQEKYQRTENGEPKMEVIFDTHDDPTIPEGPDHEDGPEFDGWEDRAETIKPNAQNVPFKNRADEWWFGMNILTRHAIYDKHRLDDNVESPSEQFTSLIAQLKDLLEELEDHCTGQT